MNTTIPKLKIKKDIYYDAVLCYIEGDKAYFTTQELSKQWGDDWNDVPYEHNAGIPYKPLDGKTDWKICSVYFDGGFARPCDNYANSPFSVEMINSKQIPWLISSRIYPMSRYVDIWAGTTLRDFINLLHITDGEVYLPIE